MESVALSVGSRVQILSSGRFRGLKGTIRTVHCLPPSEEPWYFYRIALQGTYLKEAIWFSADEVELLATQESRAPRREQARLQPGQRSTRPLVNL